MQDTTAQLAYEDSHSDSVVIPLLTNHSELEQFVGNTVTIRGIQERSKIPTVIGVMVDGPYDYADCTVTAIGILDRVEIQNDNNDNTVTANRGSGIFYRVTDPNSGELSKTKLVSLPHPIAR